MRWIDIVGLSQMDVIRAFAVKYQLHPLAVEDVLRTVERPKSEDFPGSGDQPGRLFVVARAIDQRDGRLHSEQVSMFLGRTTLLTFQAIQRSDTEPIRQRIRTAGSRLRENDASFLLYSLLDGIVDRYFPLLEAYSERLEDLEEELLERPSQETLQQIHAIKRELMLLRRAAWPMRELVANLQRDKHECLSETSQTYLRDVYDHCGQIIDLIETYREVANAIAETYISVVSNRTNDVVKVLDDHRHDLHPAHLPGRGLRHEHAHPREPVPDRVPTVLGRVRRAVRWDAALVPPPGLALTLAPVAPGGTPSRTSSPTCRQRGGSWQARHRTGRAALPGRESRR